MEKEEEEEEGNETVFVVLPSYRDSFNLYLTVRSLFKNAKHPNRVHVGIHEHIMATKTTHFKDICHLNVHKDPDNHHIRMRNVHHEWFACESASGAMATRAAILRQFYQQQKYLLFIHAHTDMVPNWDRVLILSLNQAHAVGGHAVSQLPIHIPAHHTLAENSLCLPTTFPVFASFAKLTSCTAFPMFRMRRVKKHPKKPFQTALASYKCFFTTAQVFKAHLEMDAADGFLPFLQSCEADILLSLELYTRGLHVYTPRISVATHRGFHGDHHSYYEDRHNKPEKRLKRFILTHLLSGISKLEEEEDEKEAEEIVTQPKYVEHFFEKSKLPVKAFLDWVGVDVETSVASIHARMGLLNKEPDVTELCVKFGSEANYVREKQRLDIEFG